MSVVTKLYIGDENGEAIPLYTAASATSALEDITDVNIESPSNNQVLKYNSTTEQWENGTPASSLSTLSDTTISSPANKEILKYNSTSSKWENETNYVDLIATLTAGQTTVTFTNAAITSTCRFDIYTEDVFLPVLDVVVDSTNHTITLTYEEQSSNVRVKVVIYED